VCDDVEEDDEEGQGRTGDEGDGSVDDKPAVLRNQRNE
jgi:hypothetical protein